MKDTQLGIYIEQLAAKVEDEINSESDIDRNCRLQNVKEHLRRAYMESMQMSYDPFDLIK